jgi:hypothetical protein
MSTMEDRDGFIWMDGEWLDWRNAKVHVLTHTSNEIWTFVYFLSFLSIFV